DQLPEGPAFRRRRKPIENMGVFADGKMRQQADLRAEVGQVVERTHGNIDFVADSIDVEANLRGLLFNQDSSQTTNHVRRFRSNGRPAAGGVRRRAWPGVE